MIYDKYKANLTYELDFTKGSLKDQSANGYATTVESTPYFFNSEMGRAMQFDGLADDIKTGDVAIMSEQTTISTWLKIDSTPAGYIFAGRIADPYFSAYLSSAGLQIQCGSGSGNDTRFTFTPNDSKWHHFVMIRNGSSRDNLRIYMDGSLRTSSGAGNIGAATGFNAFYGNGVNTWLKCQSTGVKVWNTAFSSEDVAKLYEEESTKKSYNLVDVKSTGSYQNILPDGDMQKTGTSDWEVYNTATLSKVSSTLEGGQALRITNSATFGGAMQAVLQDGKTYRFIGRAKTDGVAGCRATIGHDSNDDIYWEGTLAISTWESFDFITEVDSSKPKIVLAKHSSSGEWVEFDNVNIFECESDGTPKYMPTYIADGKGWNESVAAVSSGMLENTGWIVKVGDWKVVNEDGFNKSIQAEDTTTHCYMPFNQAYGTWEFDYKRTANTDVSYINFISDRIGGAVEPIGYQLLITDYGAIQDTVAVRKLTGGGASLLFVGEAGIITAGVYYKFRITRTTNGVFSIYMKGQTDTDFVLLTPNAVGGGSNPVTENTYTTCTHVNLDFDTGNIKNFKFLPYIE